MKGYVSGFLCAVLLFTIGVAIVLRFGLLEVAADVPPSALEATWMTSAVHASVKRRAGTTRIALSDSDAAAGGKLYINDCVGCHGAPGQPPSSFGAAFYPQAPQFPQFGSTYSESELFWVARHGIRMTGMYPQVPQYTDSQLWSLVAYIHRIRSLSHP